MINLKNSIKTIAMIFTGLALFSCATANTIGKQTDFLTTEIDYTAHRDLMIIFTGSDWDGVSSGLKEKIFTDDFFKKYRKRFAIYNVDVVREKGILSEEDLMRNYKYFSEYEVADTPALALETSDGDVYALAPFADYTESAEVFEAFLQKQIAEREKIVSLAAEVKSTSGPTHTKAIDEFLKKVKLPYSSRYESLIFDALASDPENESGLQKNFLLAATNIKANAFMADKNARAAADEFLKIKDNELFAPFEKQSCYYMAAYYLASDTKNDKEVLNLLNEALKLAPESEMATTIKAALYSVSKRAKN